MDLLISDNDHPVTPSVLNEEQARDDMRAEIRKMQATPDPELIMICEENGPFLIKKNPDGENLYFGVTSTMDNTMRLCFYRSPEYQKNNTTKLRPNTIDSHRGGTRDALHRFIEDDIKNYDTLAKLLHAAIPESIPIMPIVEAASDELQKAIQ